MNYFSFYIGRAVAFLYRLNTLRLASIVFRGVNESTIVKRSFFGKSLTLDVSRSSAQQLLWLQGERFVEERRFLGKFVLPGMTIVDVGANIGYYAVMFASRLQAGGKIICLEPDPKNLIELNANVATNHLEQMITVLPFAAGEDDGTTRFESGLNAHAAPEGDMEVNVRKLDSLIMTKVDFLKIDVEGYEGAVLEGARGLMEKFRPVLLLELHRDMLARHSHREVLQLLQQYYPRIAAYELKPATPIRKIMQAYGLANPLCEINDLDSLIKAYESGRRWQTCWLICQA